MKAEGEEKARLIRLLAANYCADVDEDTTTLWLMLLAPYGVDECRRAVISVVRQHGSEAVRFGAMPPFALIQRALDEQTGRVRGERSVALQAEAEWGLLLEQARKTGAWRTPTLHPTTAFVVRQMGGWERVCRWKEEELGWKRREFCAAWREAFGREEALLAGAEAVARLGTGPVSIGSRLRERAVLARNNRREEHGDSALCVRQLRQTL